MDINLANALFNDGVFSELYKAGFITEKIFAYREIYLWINAQMQTRQISKNKAVSEAQIKFNKDASTIWRALRCFTEAEDHLPEAVELEDFEY